ncbi:ubiquinone biosynthesis accessory factor UbiJ [Thermomonas flagellata]|uniref:ubiquinone biosynthesis accessory factor UbiJ n=1 Tax=Thermomonas flagellata TaxID=2888524 RepID=UPI001F040526|nr:SCP2 sterol-binding domain-containing protein [Thermomonas flagellata]
MTPLPFDWKPLAGRALERALNRLLALDPDTRAALAALDGRRVSLQLAAPPLALQIRVDGAALRVGPPDPAQAPDLGVRATLGALLRQLPPLREAGAAPVGQLRIEGDAELARRLQQLARGFDPDWQQPFVQVFGEVLGVQVADALAAALRGAGRAGRGLAQMGAEYLTEEGRDVVGRAELEAFHDDVDALRDDVERLAARIARLRRARGLPA